KWRFGNRGETRGIFHLVMAGLVPAIPIIERCAILIEIAGTSPAMTPQVLPLLRVSIQKQKRYALRYGQLIPRAPPGSPENHATRIAFPAAGAADRPGGRSRWLEFPGCRYDRHASGRATGGCPQSGRAAPPPRGRRGTLGCRDPQARSGA